MKGQLQTFSAATRIKTDTPMKRFFAHGTLDLTNGSPAQNSILRQRNVFSGPLSFRQGLIPNGGGGSDAFTLDPQSVPAKRIVGPFTRIASLRGGLGQAPQYPANSPKMLGVRAHQFGIPTIRLPLVTPPLGGGGTLGWQMLLHRGKAAV